MRLERATDTTHRSGRGGTDAAGTLADPPVALALVARAAEKLDVVRVVGQPAP